MKTTSLALLLLAFAALLLSGCAKGDPDDSQLPWAQPASWEGGMPGMGGGFGAPRQ